MIRSTKRDDRFYVEAISSFIENPLLSAGKKIEEIERLMSSRRGLKGGGQVLKLYGRQHYVDMGNKGWANRRKKLTK